MNMSRRIYAASAILLAAVLLLDTKRLPRRGFESGIRPREASEGKTAAESSRDRLNLQTPGLIDW